MEDKEMEVKKVEPIGQEPKKERKGLCVASMVLGIISLVFFCLWYISIPCAILAIIFGILGVKTPTKGMAIAGISTGAVGLVIATIIFIAIVIFGFAAGVSDVFDNDYSYRTHYNSSYFD